jgi:hypothetical protein
VAHNCNIIIQWLKALVKANIAFLNLGEPHVELFIEK